MLSFVWTDIQTQQWQVGVGHFARGGAEQEKNMVRETYSHLPCSRALDIMKCRRMLRPNPAPPRDVDHVARTLHVADGHEPEARLPELTSV